MHLYWSISISHGFPFLQSKVFSFWILPSGFSVSRRDFAHPIWVFVFMQWFDGFRVFSAFLHPKIWTFFGLYIWVFVFCFDFAFFYLGFCFYAEVWWFYRWCCWVVVLVFWFWLFGVIFWRDTMSADCLKDEDLAVSSDSLASCCLGGEDGCRVSAKEGKGKRLWQKVKYQLVEYHSLPGYLKDNEYIIGHYRSEWPLKQVFLSIFSLHNETLNVWT